MKCRVNVPRFILDADPATEPGAAREALSGLSRRDLRSARAAGASRLPAASAPAPAASRLLDPMTPTEWIGAAAMLVIAVLLLAGFACLGAALTPAPGERQPGRSSASSDQAPAAADAAGTQRMEVRLP